MRPISTLTRILYHTRYDVKGHRASLKSIPDHIRNEDLLAWVQRMVRYFTRVGNDF